MAEQLELQEVSVSYGDFVAVDSVSLSLQAGEIGCLLGPSGCGKTSLLRAIAGFEPVSGGEVRLHDRVISARDQLTPPEARRVGMVFQDFALFPHLNVQRNVGFGLHQLSRQERRARVAEMLELVGLGDYAGAYPHELSGGQQQRVALARALAPSPEILLLDEPFSSLDSELREQLAGEIRTMLKRNGVTAILVTHDRHEAFAMADRIALLQRGEIVQCDTPQNLCQRPATPFVAAFIGLGALIEVAADADGNLDNGLGQLLPEQLAAMGQRTGKLLVQQDDVIFDAASAVRLPIAGKTFRGAHYLYELQLPDGQRIPCTTSSQVDREVGDALPVRFDLRRWVAFARES